MTKPTVLVVSRDDALCSSILEITQELPRVQVGVARTIAEAHSALQDRHLAVVLAHLTGPADVNEIIGLTRSLTADRRSVATVVVGDRGQAEAGLTLLRRGAADFLERPLNLRHLAYLLDVLTLRATVEPEAPAASPIAAAGPNADYLYCPSSQMGLVMEQVRQVAPVDTTILLQGETGTGKTRLATVIHDLSGRREGPFRVINCAALSASLVESELFGHVKGAFTGADRDRVGKFAEVGDGTLVLDEVDLLPLETQAKLLRVIEDRVFEPVGGNKPQPMKARLIAASNRDLTKQVAAGQFRADLFYRLNVVTFDLPALRERPAVAIDAMIKKFIEEFAGKAGRDIRWVTPEARRALHAYTWPGNVRELRNAIERAVALRSAGPIELTNLPEPVRRAILVPAAEPVPTPTVVVNQAPAVTPQPGQTLAEAKDAAEAGRIAEALRRNSNNRLKAAAELGISRMTLYKKLHRYGWVDVSF